MVHRTPDTTTDRQVGRILIIEGLANVAVLGMKLVVGLSTGSLAVLGDALHSLSDVANNVVAWFVLRVSVQPPDRDHPYGHRKFETLAVFVLASLLTVLGIELGIGALRRETHPTPGDPWTLPLMLCVLVVNLGLASWEGAWARRLDSEILGADARHTLADVLTTIVVIVGWQVSSRGYPWLDTVCALAVAALVLTLAFGLFKRAIPILVDRVAVDPEIVREIASGVTGVRAIKSVRSRSKGKTTAVDMVVVVDSHMTTSEAHDIADAIERKLRKELHVEDATIHLEPD
ncbi:MAG: cation transporter [Myxococcales bacterium SG8_38]|nr:MAG: cation transporter [Myxococcales bacterium SG8_38]